MPDGLSLESDVVRHLRHAGWNIETSEALDHDGSDILAVGRWGRESAVRGMTQLTLMGGNVHKLRRFLEKCRKFPHDAHFYIVPKNGMKPDEVASRVSEIFESYLVFTKVRAGYTSGFFLVDPKATKPNTWTTFNIEERIAKLDKRGDPKSSSKERRSGKIVLMPRNALIIREYGNERREYWAYDADTLDALARYMRRYRQGGPSPMSMKVSFVPYKDEDDELRALSIRFLSETRDP